MENTSESNELKRSASPFEGASLGGITAPSNTDRPKKHLKVDENFSVENATIPVNTPVGNDALNSEKKEGSGPSAMEIVPATEDPMTMKRLTLMEDSAMDGPSIVAPATKELLAMEKPTIYEPQAIEAPDTIEKTSDIKAELFTKPPPKSKALPTNGTVPPASESTDQDCHSLPNQCSTAAKMSDRGTQSHSTLPEISQENRKSMVVPKGFPILPIFLPEFQQAESLVMNLCDKFCQDVRDINQELGYGNDEIDAVCEELQRWRTPSHHYPIVGPVTPLGPTGKGKSSTVNSITDEENAFSFAGGKRGTYVSHNYCTALADQLHHTVVDIFYLDDEEIEQQVRKFATDILHHVLLTEGDEEAGDGDPDDDESEADLACKRKDTAAECLSDVLCEKPKFATSKKVVSFFQKKFKKNSKDNGLTEILHEILPLVETVMQARNRKHDVETIAQPNQARLRQEVKRLTRGSVCKGNAELRDPSPWPFILKVQIRIRNNEFLKAGLVLSDTPGSGDTNMHVVENTNRSLKEAGVVLLVAHHLRFEVDEVLQSQLKSCIRLGKIHNVVLVLTKCDEMEEYSEDEREELSEKDKSLLDTGEERLKVLRHQIDAAEKGKATSRGDPDAFMRYDDVLQRLQEDKVVAARELRQMHHLIRCKGLKAKAAPMLRDIENSRFSPDLMTFTISNTQYQLLQTEKQGPIFLDLEATGVPALRRKLLQLSTEGKMDTLASICTTRLPWIFAGIDGILNKTPTERREELRSVITSSPLSCRSLTEGDREKKSLKDSLLNEFDDTVMETLKKNKSEWNKAATRLVDHWKSMNGGTMNAVLKRDGLHRHKKQGDFNWTSDVHRIMLSRKRFSAAFDEFDRKVENEVVFFNKRLKAYLKDLCDELEHGEHSRGLRLRPLIQFIITSCDVLAQDMKDHFEQLGKFVSSLRHEITLDAENGDYREKRDAEGNVKQHIVGRAMKQIYIDSVSAKALEKKDKGQKLARVQVLRRGLCTDTDTDVFQTIGKLAKDTLVQYLERWVDAARKRVDDTVSRILHEFDRRCCETKVKREPNPEAEERLRELTQRAQDMVSGQIKSLITTLSEFATTASKTSSM